MKRIFNWQIMLGIALIALSALLYFGHYLIFHDAHHIFIYLVGDIAFVPVEVLLVTLLIHKLLQHREKRSMMNKLNMVIGAFYSEVGTELLRESIKLDDSITEEITHNMTKLAGWSKKDFDRTAEEFKKRRSDIKIEAEEFSELRSFLKDKRDFLLGLIENPNLLEHEEFTELLWAVFHLTEELMFRDDFKELPKSDAKHLTGDLRRVYGLLAANWTKYMRHLKNDYPYLFSLAVRTNPFKGNISAVVYE